MNEIRAKATVLRFLPGWISAAVGLALLIWGVGGAASAQSSEDAGTIQEIKPYISDVTVNTGDKVLLSVIVIGPDGTVDQGLASGADIIWAATDGIISPSIESNTEVIYTSPEQVGLYTVTATAVSNCEGICTATISVRVRVSQSDPYIGPLPPVLPRILRDPQGNTYEVFTPEDGGKFIGDDFSISADSGVVQNGEFIGVRMYEDSSASNNGTSGQDFLLIGNEYAIAVVDSGGSVVTSYELRNPIRICIPLAIPVAERFSVSTTDLVLVAVSNDGEHLYAMSATVRISSLGYLTICGDTITIPVNVAAAIPGQPPALTDGADADDESVLPATGAVSPSSPFAVAWVLFAGVALIAASVVLARHRRSSR